MNANRCGILKDYKIQECQSNNAIAQELGENILLKEKNDALNTKVENEMETYKVEKITNDSLQMLLA